MKNVWRGVLLGSVLTATISTQAASCGDIVAATLDEMRAGAGEQWSEERAATARAAAGAACVKALSGRYATARADAEAGVDDADADSAAPAANGADARAAADRGGSEAGGLWPFSGGAVRSITGSPAKKPYERRRAD